ncbi:hypothetical protein ACKKBF_B02800 [Auxenochlorella protothecoides x Auxenochlorella symbiontica]
MTPPEPQPTETVIRFKNEFGETLVGWLLDAGSKDNTVILCHGYMSNATHCHFQRLAAALARAGVSSLRFDHAMAVDGSSERRRSFLMGNHAQEVAEIQAAVDALEGAGYTTRVVLGHSKGGLNAFMFGAQAASPPQLVVSLAGRFKPRDGVLQRFGPDILDQLAASPAMPRKEANGMEWVLTLEDVEERVNIDVEALATRWPAGTRLVLIHGREDTTIPWQEAEYLGGLLPHARTVYIPGANHNFTNHAAELEGAVLEAVLGAAA